MQPLDQIDFIFCGGWMAIGAFATWGRDNWFHQTKAAPVEAAEWIFGTVCGLLTLLTNIATGQMRLRR